MDSELQMLYAKALIQFATYERVGSMSFPPELERKSFRIRVPSEVASWFFKGDHT